MGMYLIERSNCIFSFHWGIWAAEGRSDCHEGQGCVPPPGSSDGGSLVLGRVTNSFCRNLENWQTHSPSQAGAPSVEALTHDHPAWCYHISQRLGGIRPSSCPLYTFHSLMLTQVPTFVNGPLNCGSRTEGKTLHLASHTHTFQTELGPSPFPPTPVAHS